MSSRNDEQKPRTSKVLRRVEIGLWTTAAVFLGLYLGALAEAELIQAFEGERLDQARARLTLDRADAAPATAADAVDAEGVTPPLVWDVAGGDVIGRILIEDAGVEAIVLEGDDDTTLRRAVGHLPHTALPGEGGNVGLAGHRDSFFRGLRKVQKGQRIDLETPHGTFAYRVESVQVVEPEDTWVLDDGEREMLTLVTCYPFHHFGNAPRRFVVQAERLS
jgi:LPXTG-site transpeptidase (sortase) family protein